MKPKTIGGTRGTNLRTIAIVLFLSVWTTYGASLSKEQVSYLASVIYRVEGGDKTKWPYGVKSIKCKDKAEAKRITENSVRNNWKRWEAAGKPGHFIDFMADRWCPKAADPQGNINWKKNMKAIIAKEAKGKEFVRSMGHGAS